MLEFIGAVLLTLLCIVVGCGFVYTGGNGLVAERHPAHVVNVLVGVAFIALAVYPLLKMAGL